MRHTTANSTGQGETSVQVHTRRGLGGSDGILDLSGGVNRVRSAHEVLDVRHVGYTRKRWSDERKPSRPTFSATHPGRGRHAYARVTQIGDLIGPEFGALSYDIPAPIPVYMIRQQSSISLLWRLLFQSAEEELQHLGRVRSAFRVLERDRVNAVPDARDKLAQDRK